MSLFLGGLFVGIPLGIIFTIVVSVCLINGDDNNEYRE